MSRLSWSRLRTLLHYCPETGHFTWLKKSSKYGAKKLGQRAGGAAARGYLCIGIDMTRHASHRLAWFYMTGEWPAGEIDHRNGNRSDNGWANLRIAPTRTFNAENMRRAHCDSALGVLGVYKHGTNYRARIKAGGSDHCLGTYPTIELASAAYLKAKRKLHAGNTL